MGLLLSILFMLVQLYMYICLWYLIILLHTVIYLMILWKLQLLFLLFCGWTRGVRVVFFRARRWSSNSIRMYKSNFTTKKIVKCTHGSVWNCCTIFGMMYLGADNSSIDCRETFAIAWSASMQLKKYSVVN